MQSALITVLLGHKDELEQERSRLEEQMIALNKRIYHLNELISESHSIPSHSSPAKGELKVMPPPKAKQTRVRGVFAAAVKAVEQLSDPFDKNQLIAQLKLDDEFAGKEITTSNIRNALRLLKDRGLIKVESEATATSCARYVKAA
jgi:hypothetical protein